MLYWNKNIVSDEIIIYNSKGQSSFNINKPENNSFSLINFEERNLFYCIS
jgi:hypothetical protein